MATATNILFQWTDAYSVGIPEIDHQHKGLIRLINDLHLAMLERRAKLGLSAILHSLVRYTEQHFQYEETMMKERKYSALAAHQQEHRDLTRQVKELQNRFDSGKLLITNEVMRFLKEWLTNHILQRDMAYAKELGARV